MQKLHLVGITTDQSGLILSARRGARSGGYSLVLDDALANAVEELRARQEEEAAARRERPESRLPIGEIQTRLRRGKSVKEVAKEAGVEPEWIERFAAPVFAEQAEVISRVQRHHYQRQRLGPSALRIGDAVRRNLAERGVSLAPDDFAAAWKTHQRPDGRWIVTFSFPYRGATKHLKFEVRPNGDVVGADQLTAQIAYVAPPKRPAARPRPVAPTSPDGAPKRAVVGSGFRPDPVVKPASRPGKERERAAATMAKAAAKRAAEAERAAARKARERAQLIAKQEREARLEAQRREREAAAQRREALAAARLAAAEQAERERAAAAVAAAKQAEREAARRSARLKVKAESKAVAAKRSAAAKASRAATSTKAAAARARSGDAPAKPTTRPSPSQRVDAPPPPRRGGAGSAASPASPASRSTKAAAAPAAGRGASPAPEVPTVPAPAATPRTAAGGDRGPRAGGRASAPREARADRAQRSERPERPERGARPAERSDGSAADTPRPQFRPGSVDPAGDATAPVPAVRGRGPSSEPAPSNGTARVRPPGVRRTRPLRAT